MKKNADLFADLPELAFAHADNVLALDPNFSRVRLHQADDMFQQNAFAAAAAPNNRKGLARDDLQIDAAQNFLLPDSFRQCPHRNHRRRLARNQTRLNGGLERWRRFDHRNA